MTRLSVSEFRSDLSDVLSIVAFRGERIVIQRNGRDLAALVPIEDFLLLEGAAEKSAAAAAPPDAASEGADAPLSDAEIAEVERALGIRTRRWCRRRFPLSRVPV